MMSFPWKTVQIQNLPGKQAQSSNYPAAMNSHPFCITEYLTWKEQPSSHHAVVRIMNNCRTFYYKTFTVSNADFINFLKSQRMKSSEKSCCLFFLTMLHFQKCQKSFIMFFLSHVNTIFLTN